MPLDDPAIPCGLVAKSYFNDTFRLEYEPKGEPVVPIKIYEKHIAWSSDLDFKFNNIKKDLPKGKTFEDIQWMDMTDEHFIVWMRTAGLPNFRKLWGTIEGDL